MAYVPGFTLTPESFDYLNPVALSRYPVAGFPGFIQCANAILSAVFSQSTFADIQADAYSYQDQVIELIEAGLEADTLENDAVDFARATFAYLDSIFPGRITDQPRREPTEGGERGQEPVIPNQPTQPTRQPETTPTAPERMPTLPSPSRQPSFPPVQPNQPPVRQPSTQPTQPRISQPGLPRQVEVPSIVPEQPGFEIPRTPGTGNGQNERPGNGEETPPEETPPEETPPEETPPEETKPEAGQGLDYGALEEAIYNALVRWSIVLRASPPTVLTKPAETTEISNADIKNEMEQQMQNLLDLVGDFDAAGQHEVSKQPVRYSTP